jgi:hypothetical protein
MDVTKLAMGNTLSHHIDTLEHTLDRLNNKPIKWISIVFEDNQTEVVLLTKESKKLIAHHKKTKELELQALEQQFKKL